MWLTVTLETKQPIRLLIGLWFAAIGLYHPERARTHSYQRKHAMRNARQKNSDSFMNLEIPVTISYCSRATQTY